MKKIVVLGTGGTIAGLADSPTDHVAYTAALVGVDALIQAVPGRDDALQGYSLVSEQVAQIDSKDMSFAVWTALAQRVLHHLSQPDVQGLVITHGTDTLEETAYFLVAVLPVHLQLIKPVVLTGAMRPASVRDADGPQNLRDAVTVAQTTGARGVMVVFAGQIHAALAVQKGHTSQCNAFHSRDAQPLGYIKNVSVYWDANWPPTPVNQALCAIEKLANIETWPRVEIVMNYVGASGWMVDAMLNFKTGALQGLVVAATGHGTIHRDLEDALRRAVQAGVRVVRSSRCAQGWAVPGCEFPDSKGLSPVKARVALMLELM